MNNFLRSSGVKRYSLENQISFSWESWINVDSDFSCIHLFSSVINSPLPSTLNLIITPEISSKRFSRPIMTFQSGLSSFRLVGTEAFDWCQKNFYKKY